MYKINLSTGEVRPTIDLDALLEDVEVPSVRTEVSATNLSDTKNVGVSATNLSDTNLSATKGQYMNQWKKENKDTIRFDTNKGGKALLQRESMKRGISVTKLIKGAIKEYLTNHPID